MKTPLPQRPGQPGPVPGEASCTRGGRSQPEGSLESSARALGQWELGQDGTPGGEEGGGSCRQPHTPPRVPGEA